MGKLGYVVYKITFPNGKIYVGKDIGEPGHSLRYFGSWDNLAVEADFSREEILDFTLKKEILFESKDKSEVTAREAELIRILRANEPQIGYNRTHRKRATKFGAAQKQGGVHRASSTLPQRT